MDSDVLIINNDSTITNNDSTKFGIFYNDSYYDDLYKSQIIELDSKLNKTNWKKQNCCLGRRFLYIDSITEKS